MAFPLSPANNQTALVNGIVYQWNNTLGVWKRNGSLTSITAGQGIFNSATAATTNGSGSLIVSGGAGITGNVYTGGIFITGAANGITFADGSTQTAAATGIDQTARTTANNASSNTIVIQGVDVAQNARITIAEGVDTGQNTRMTIIEGVDVGQNTRMTIIEGVDTTQNTNITIIEGVDVGQNTRMGIIEGVDTTQNTNITIIQGVDVGQNTRMGIIEGVDVGQNTRITAVDTYAAGAYGKANTSIQTTGDQTLTGNLTITKELSVTGNLTVLGTTTTINTSSFTVNDSLLVLGVGNYTSDLLDLGFSAHYNDGTNAHAGFIRDAADKEWYVFEGYTPEHSSNNNIDINHASFAKANVNVDYLKGNLIATSSVVNGLEIYPYITSAYSAANTNATNITNIQGVNTTQNTNITNADTKAQSAFDKSNTSFSSSGGTIAGNVTANSVIANTSIYVPTIYSTGATTKLELSDIGLVGITVAGQTYQFGGSGIESSQGIFGGSFGGNRLSLSNETNLISNRYDTVKIQTGTTGTVVNEWSFSNNTIIFPDSTVQRTAYQGFGIDNVARTTANTASDNITIIQGVNTTQNTNISAVDAYAAGAYGKANSAAVLAQAAFDTANTGGGSNTAFSTVIDTFVGNNSNTTFTLSTTPYSENDTFVYLNGVYQQKNTYSVSGANIIFTAVATSNDTIEVITVAGNQSNGISSGIDSYARTTANSAAALAQAAFDTANTGGGGVAVESYNTRAYTSDGVGTTFTISAGHSANSILVFENGVCQEPIADYTVSGTTLTFLGGAPTVNTRIQIRELPV